MNDRTCFFEQTTQALQQILLIGGRQEYPIFRKNPVVIPALVGRIIFLRHGLAKDMAGSPGDDGITLMNIGLFSFRTAVRP